MKVYFKLFLMFISCLLILSSCRKDKFATDPSVRLSFSADTVKFDTVFTSIGSATRAFKVYNKDNKKVKISSLRIAGGDNSYFRLNVDGVPGKFFTDIEIGAKDSIYIYAAVTIDPTFALNPFIIFDSILFTINGNRQHVVLDAYGQNAYFHYGEIYKSGDTTWTNDKPHVIINSFLVDSQAKLTIPAGTRIYMHSGSAFFVNGTLIADGTKHDSITFQGDRLEQYYVGLPGNWGYIRFLKPSKDNVLTHVIIKDGLDGVVVDSLSVNNNPKLTMHKCMIRNMYSSGISAGTGSITADNCLVYNCGDYCAQLYFGGQYDFKFCTFANYGNIAINHQKPCVLLTNYYQYNNQNFPDLITPTQAAFTDCIIYGSLDNELVVDSVHVAGLPLNYNFSYCDIKLNTGTGSNFDNCKTNEDPLFDDYSNDKLTLQTGSPCLNHGRDAGIYQDYNDEARNTNNPSIGCYEK